MGRATVSTPGGLIRPRLPLPPVLTLHQSFSDLTRPIPVIVDGRKLWAEQSDLEANPRGLTLVRNRKQRIMEAHFTSPTLASAASRIGKHSKGKAYRQSDIGGNLWALTGTPGARAY